MLSFLISLTLLIGAVAVYGILIAPLFDETQKLRSFVVARDKQLNEQKQIIDKVQGLLQQYQGAGSFQETLSLSLPNEPYLSQAVGGVQGLASLNKLVLSSMQAELMPFQVAPNVPQYVRNLGTLRISFVVKGSYADFKKFLSQLETNVRITDVKELSVAAPAQQPQGTVYEYAVVAFAYYQEKESDQSTNN